MTVWGGGAKSHPEGRCVPQQRGGKEAQGPKRSHWRTPLGDSGRERSGGGIDLLNEN